MKDLFNIKNLILILQGAIVGTGAILPGISGGVLCVAFGIYKPMMELFSHPKKSFKTHYKMFIPFVIGWVIGFILLAKVVETLFAISESIALMLFFGLICGTLPELIKDSEEENSNINWSPFVLALAISYLIFGILENGAIGEIAVSTGSFILCGAIWGLSMIIPGLSSSSLLIYMGLYEQMTAGIAAIDFSVIVPLLIGLLITILAFARLVNYLYEKHSSLISKIIIGIVISSALKIIPTNFENVLTFIIAIICFAGGFFLIRFMDSVRKKQQKDS